MNGKKTWLGLILATFAKVAAVAGKLVSGDAVDPTELAEAVGAIGVIVGAAHKLKKGE